MLYRKRAIRSVAVEGHEKATVAGSETGRVQREFKAFEADYGGELRYSPIYTCFSIDR